MKRWRLSDREAWWSVAAAASFNLVGMLLRYTMGTRVPSMSSWPILGSMACAAIILAVLIGTKRASSTKIASVLFLANSLSVSAAVFLVERQLVGQVENWIPFRPNQLGCLVAALLAPSLLTGTLAIAAHVGSSLLVLWTMAETVRGSWVAGEPGAVVAFAIAGLFVLGFRFRQLELRDRVHKAREEATVARDLARSFLQIRDLMNTPLQTLELTLEWLRAEPSADQAVLDGAHHAVEQLRGLNQHLRKFETEVEWPPEMKEKPTQPLPSAIDAVPARRRV
jgi:hypothetical protein